MELNNNDNNIINQGANQIGNQYITIQNGNNSNKIIKIELSKTFEKKLIDIETNIAHSQAKNITMFDLYVPPDLKFSNPEKVNGKNKSVYYNLKDILEFENPDGIKYVLLGENKSGKSFVCKYTFNYLLNLNLIPVLINGSEITNNINSAIILSKAEKKFKSQYNTEITLSDLLENGHNEKIVLIIDDFHKSGNLKKDRERKWYQLIKNIEKNFKNIIITGDNLMPLNVILSKSKKKNNIFEDFDTYYILEFGAKLRYKIVDKWNKLGLEDTVLKIREQEIIKKNNTDIKRIETIISKGFVPAFPFYLLTLLQTFENRTNASFQNYSIHGFYYEFLIKSALNNTLKKSEYIDTYLSFLANLCFYLFEMKQLDLSIDEFENVFNLFCEKYDITSNNEYNYETVLTNLTKAKLINIDESIYFYPEYIYYFFVAQYMANNISNKEVKEYITKMSQRLYNDEFSSIILFLTHLSKDSFIIEQLLDNAKDIFKNEKIAKLENDITAINNLITSLPKQVLELIDVQEAIEEDLEEQDREEREYEDEYEDDYEEKETNYDLDEDIDTIDLYAKITRALKTIDILGQIVKKYWGGELTAKTKYEIAEETYFLGLRTLNFYLQLLVENKDLIAEYIKDLITNKRIKDQYSLRKIADETSNNYVFKLSFLASWGITKRVSNAIGYEKLDKTFKKILDNNQFNSVKLIDLSIKLDFCSFPKNEIKEYKQKFEKCHLPNLVMKNLVVNYLYMFETDYKKRMKIANMIGIEVKTQRMIEGTSRIKRKTKRK